MIVLAAAAAACAVVLLCRPASPDLPVLTPGAARTAGPRAVPLLVAAGVAATVVVGPVAAVVAGAGLGARRLWLLRRRRAEAVATAGRVLEACELLSAEIAAGQPPDRALARAGEAWSLLAPAAEVAALGGDVPVTLRRLGEIPGAGELRLVGAAWEVAHRSGSGLADALGRVCATVRADRATRRVVESELASARATARLIAGLPVVALLLGSGAGGGSWAFLSGTPLGWACLVGGLALGLLGLTWIERIAAGVVP